MRKFSAFLACGALLLMSVAWVEGQQEKKQPGGGGFGFGGFGKAQNDPFALLTREEVKKELDVTEEQMDKLPDEVMIAISKVLTEKQSKRFKQIYLQKKENNAFKDTNVQKELKMTDEQKKNILTILTDEEKELKDLAPKFGVGGGGGKGKGGFGKGNTENKEKIETVKKDAKEKIYMVLTKDQRKSWSAMVGEEFKFTQGFGGGAFKKDAKKDPTDN